MTKEQVDKLMAESPWGWNLLDEAVRENDFNLEVMTPNEAFNVILEYEGIIGYSKCITNTVKALGL